MQYMGGKKLASKGIAEVINIARERPDQQIWDPFCGGLSTAVAFGGPVLCSDLSLPLISLYQAVAQGWEPPDSVSPEEWEAAKSLPDTDPMKGFCGFGCSWMGHYFGRYAVDKRRPNDHGVFARRAKKALLRDVPLLIKRGGMFAHMSFFDLEPMKDDIIIYCDPPYYGVTGFPSVPEKFDHVAFWLRCVEWARCGVPVFVSEYACPLDEHQYELVWTKSTPLGRFGGGTRRQQECLFWVKG